MAVLTGSFQSKALSRKVSFTAVIPTAASSIYDPESVRKKNNQPLKTLYLLHGWDGNHEDWLHNTHITELAIKYQLAIILADGQNSFYVDQPNGDQYGQFIGEELVQQTRQLFHLSTKREDTIIGGLSMGGYGALRNGFYYAETFGQILAFSSKLLSKHTSEIYDGTSAIEKRLRSVIGDINPVNMPDDLDVEDLALRINQSANRPTVFLACGTEDDLLEEHREYHTFLEEHHYPHQYVEAPGGHEWSFWNTILEQSLTWLYRSEN